MLTVTAKTQGLLDIVQANRDKHRAVFEAALAGWKAQYIAALEKKVEALKAGRIPELHIGLANPTDHTADYDRAIRMLKLHLDAGQETIRLPEDVASQLVDDDWGWKRQWSQTSSSYANDAYVSAYGDS